MGYVFISYSSKDGAEAEKIKLLLNDRGFETWMAPGDIPAGKKYASVIVSAIRDCSCFLLLLTENAQASTWVPKEVERAVSFKRPIVPVQLDELELNDEFSLYISTDQAVRVKSLFLNDEGMQHALASIRVHLAAAGGNEPDEASPEKNAPREEPLSFDADSDDDIFGEEFDAEPEFSRISRRGGTLIVRIFNSVMSVAAYPYQVPSKTCNGDTDSPCEVFSRLNFPTEEFIPSADGFSAQQSAEALRYEGFSGWQQPVQ